jgi:HlyD family secretion protein
VFAGKVRRIEPYGFTKVSALGIEEQRVNIIIDFADEPTRWQALGHGYRVETRVVIWNAPDVLKVPLSALFRKGDDWAVFVQQDGQASLRRVDVGHSNDLEAEIVDGLAVGERVVLHPSDRIADGTRIVERQEG